MREQLIKFGIGFLVAGISGAIDALIIALAAPESFMEHWKAYSLGAVVLGMKGALMWFKQHEADLSDVVNPRRLGAVLLVALLGANASACVTWNGLAGAPPAAQQAKLSELQQFVARADQVLTIASTLQDVEIVAHDNKRVSDASHAIVQQAFKEFAVAAKQGLELAKDLTKPETTRMDAARSIGAIGLELVGRIEKHLPPEVAAYLTSLRSVLKLLGFSA